MPKKFMNKFALAWLTDQLVLGHPAEWVLLCAVRVIFLYTAVR